MQKTVFIIHGTEGDPQENWFPWLKQRIEERTDYNVIVPQFPTPPVVPAKIDEWFEVLKKHEELFDRNTVIVGHSLGGVFTLRVLEELDDSIKAAFFVGAPIGVRPILNYARDNSFSGFEFDWDTIKSGANVFFVFHSDDDPYVSLENGEQLAEKLRTNLTFIPNAGHFNKKAGYTKFEELWNKLEPVLK